MIIITIFISIIIYLQVPPIKWNSQSSYRDILSSIKSAILVNSCITFQNDELTHDGHIKQVNSVNLEGGETGYLPRRLKHHAA